jgi:hypothetical protein
MGARQRDLHDLTSTARLRFALPRWPRQPRAPASHQHAIAPQHRRREHAPARQASSACDPARTGRMASCTSVGDPAHRQPRPTSPEPLTLPMHWRTTSRTPTPTRCSTSSFYLLLKRAGSWPAQIFQFAQSACIVSRDSLWPPSRRHTRSTSPQRSRALSTKARHLKGWMTDPVLCLLVLPPRQTRSISAISGLSLPERACIQPNSHPWPAAHRKPGPTSP